MMSSGIGERLKMARHMATLTQDALAERVPVSKMAISKYENEQITPSSDVLIALARALGQPIEFFLRGPMVATVQPVYRGKAALRKKKNEDVITAQLQEWLERYLVVEGLFPDVSPGFAYPAGFPVRVSSLEEVEEAAEALRKAWQLGDNPIDNLTELLEEQGIRVGLVDGNDHFDACLFELEDGSPVMAVKQDIPGDRQRFSLAHELGHLMLEVAETLKDEDAANRFAGAFLVPGQAVLYELGPVRRHLDTLELHLLKHKYGVSMQTWAFRARALGILDDKAFQSFWKEVNRKKWREQEPGDPFPPEKPQRLVRLVLRALSEEVIGRARAAELLGMPWVEFVEQQRQQHGEDLIAVRA
jgi:Zn-dependent peptidase ImmA (M78 family)/transcriptional regulator with XRE-family HTH domain